MPEHSMVVARLHHQIHLAGEGCCCPARDVTCAGCPQHKYSSVPNVDVLRARLAEYDAQQAAVQRVIEAARAVVGTHTPEELNGKVAVMVWPGDLVDLYFALDGLGAPPEWRSDGGGE